MKSKITALVSISLLALALAIPALAGGWATISLETLPTGVVAGEQLTVRFAVRQHGRTLLADLAPTVRAQHVDTGESFLSDATSVDGKPGYYEAVLTFPSQGTWEWSIQAFNMDQPMPELVVSASAPVSTVTVEETSRMPLLAGVVGTVIALVALLVVLRSKKSWALVIVVLGLLVGGVGFASAASQEKPTNGQDLASPSQPASLVETGQALFIAKGCLTCHFNSRIDGKYYEFRSDFGPNLSHYTAGPEFLKMWLANPALVRPITQMPDLELDETEIAALIAFLNGDSNQEKPPSAAHPEAEQVVTATPNK
jgi:FtsP/CotA-like multicopper oxidase with cupredoxin domain